MSEQQHPEGAGLRNNNNEKVVCRGLNMLISHLNPGLTGEEVNSGSTPGASKQRL